MALPFTRSPAGKKSIADKNAEREAAQKQGFVREVDEALREDEMLGAIRRYAVPVSAALGVGLLALGGYLAWTNHQESVRAGQAEQIVLALDKVDSGQQDAAFRQLAPVAQDGGDGPRSAARMLQAGIATRQGRLAAAAQLLAQVAADDHAPKPYRDLATLRFVALSYDKLPPADVVSRLRSLAVPGAPFFGSAGEMLGMAYLREGHHDLAAPLFGAIAHDAAVPESLRARARQLAGALGFDAVDDVSRAPAGAAEAGTPAAPSSAATAAPSSAATAAPSSAATAAPDSPAAAPSAPPATS